MPVSLLFFYPFIPYFRMRYPTWALYQSTWNPTYGRQSCPRMYLHPYFTYDVQRLIARISFTELPINTCQRVGMKHSSLFSKRSL